MAPPIGQPRRSGSGSGGKGLFYAFIVFAACWLQLTANVFVYFWRHNHDHPYDPSAATAPFPVSRLSRKHLRIRGSENENGNIIHQINSTANHNATGNATGNLHSGRKNLGLPTLEAQLLNIRNRFERVKDTLEDDIRRNEEASLDLSSNKNPRRVFVPFTLRDAQRTVPTQIPHGFEVFDFIDLYATNGDQKQTRPQPQNQKAKSSDIDGNDPNEDSSTSTSTNAPTPMAMAGIFRHGKPMFVYQDLSSYGKARLFRNGKPISEAHHHENNDNDNDNDNNNDAPLEECLGYSKKCYRHKLLRVIRYLLSLQAASPDTEFYYFYMEADNDLCVPLDEIRDLAFRHQRYFVSTGIGASGWIMSQEFLEDFYDFWNNLDSNHNVDANANTNTNTNGLSETQALEPDSVAAALLKEKRNWSVTRRYLTSHSILVGSTKDEASIEALFVPPEPVENQKPATEGSVKIRISSNNNKIKNNNTNTQRTIDQKHLVTPKKKDTPEEAAKKAPMMEPSRYLPRCLEPHRGVWKNSTTTNSIGDSDSNSDFDVDVHHWRFFDYDLCPESDIFPCAEGQLEELAGKDPYYTASK